MDEYIWDMSLEFLLLKYINYVLTDPCVETSVAKVIEVDSWEEIEIRWGRNLLSGPRDFYKRFKELAISSALRFLLPQEDSGFFRFTFLVYVKALRECCQ